MGAGLARPGGEEEKDKPSPSPSLPVSSSPSLGDFEGRWLVIPHAIAGYIARLTAPPTPEQKEHIERHLAEYHGLPPVVWAYGNPWLPYCDSSRLSFTEIVDILDMAGIAAETDHERGSAAEHAELRGSGEARRPTGLSALRSASRRRKTRNTKHETLITNHSLNL